MGRYMALAFHAPDRLPAAPPVPLPCREMTDTEMKARLLNWAQKGANA
ncbi:MAG: hypothetical protein MR400_09635 [Clostridiales bacterium]|nr:hypothetical protein [Clostridiales bacterium]